MTRWYESANEASFKSVEGGYVFQSPSPWIFARPSYYLVSEAKKAEILVPLGRWRLLLLSLPAIMLSIMLVPIVWPETFGHLLLPAFRLLGTGLFSMLLFAVMALLLAPLIAMPQIYLARSLRPLLADAPRTEQRIKVAEQLPKIAASVSGKVLAIGLVGALAMIVSAGLLLLDAFQEGRLAGSPLYSSSVLAVAGALLTAYFIYLMRLKAKMKRAG
jgi:hypothetical protein